MEDDEPEGQGTQDKDARPAEWLVSERYVLAGHLQVEQNNQNLRMKVIAMQYKLKRPECNQREKIVVNNSTNIIILFKENKMYLRQESTLL